MPQSSYPLAQHRITNGVGANTDEILSWIKKGPVLPKNKDQLGAEIVQKKIIAIVHEATNQIQAMLKISGSTIVYDGIHIPVFCRSSLVKVKSNSTLKNVTDILYEYAHKSIQKGVCVFSPLNQHTNWRIGDLEQKNKLKKRKRYHFVNYNFLKNNNPDLAESLCGEIEKSCADYIYNNDLLKITYLVCNTKMMKTFKLDQYAQDAETILSDSD